MKAQIVLACAVLMFSAVSTCVAQESSPTESDVAREEVVGGVFEKVTHLPTDATSWAIQASEALGVIGEGVAGPLGAAAAALSSSYTASPNLDMVGSSDPNAFVNSYVQQLQTEQNQQRQLYNNYQQMLQSQTKAARTVPAGPSISPCYGCRSVR
jgi:hypothetical protein